MIFHLNTAPLQDSTSNREKSAWAIEHSIFGEAGHPFLVKEPEPSSWLEVRATPIAKRHCQFASVPMSIGFLLTFLMGVVAFDAQVGLSQDSANKRKKIELVVLGIAQDAGFPQAACAKDCCKLAWENKELRRNVASIGLLDYETGKRYLFDCTPDFPDQLRMLDQRLPANASNNKTLDGIFLTHAHIGHYCGLVHLGREVIGANQVPTYVMPRMSSFLKTNGPWSQLVKLENISLKLLADSKQGKPPGLMTIKLSDRLFVEPFVVPHRDEFSETVGFKIKGPGKTVVFLPDIDKWSKWDHSIEKIIRQSDLSYLDGTFFENGEIPGRDMALIPHPFVSESINRFAPLDERERKKVRFIHFNHTNPVLQKDSNATKTIERAGMAIAVQGEVIEI